MKRQDVNDRLVAGTLSEDVLDGAFPVNSEAASRDHKAPALLRLMPGAFQLTETGNAERFVAQHRDRVRYCPPRRKWLLWDGHRWAWDERADVQRLGKATIRSIYGEAERANGEEFRKAIGKHARDSEKAARRQAMLALAQSEIGMPVLPTELDADPWALNCQNGTINLRTGELRPHRREDLLTKMTSVEYCADARHDLWDRYLIDATGGDTELSAYLQRAVGYALQGTVTEKAFWFLYGPPDGMKSTFIDAVSAALGDYAAAASFTTWLVQTNTGGNRGDLVSLRGTRLVCSVEVRKGARFDEAIIKAITGGDELKAAAKFEAEITFRPSFALWLAANDAPVIRDDDEGAWSRVRRVPFENPLPKGRQDPQMREKLKASDVRAAVLAWAVQGCLMWQRDGLGTCSAVERSSAEYRAEMDRLAGFFEERCVFGPVERVETSTLRIAYESWCRENGVKAPVNAKEFAKRLGERDCAPTKTNGKRYWSGLRLLGAWETFGGRDTGSDRDTFPRKSSRESDKGNSREQPTLGDPADPEGALDLGPNEQGEW